MSFNMPIMPMLITRVMIWTTSSGITKRLNCNRIKMKINKLAGMLLFLLPSLVTAQEDLNTKLDTYVHKFNSQDNEAVINKIDNKSSAAWMKDNIPLFACPDSAIEEIYYFRWWSYRKHIKETPEGTIVTEFIEPVKHAGRYNALSCALGHHIYEGRWLRDTQYVNQYIRYWLEKDQHQQRPHFHQFSSWVADAIYNRYLVNADSSFVISLLDSLDKDYRLWEKERGLSNGMFGQHDVKDGMEESISGSCRDKNIRPTINSYMYGNARALAALAALAGRDSLQQRYTQLAAQLKDLVQQTLWDDTAAFFKVRLAKGPLSGAREEIGFIPWYFSLPDDNATYARAWQQLTDPAGFKAPWGLTTAEQRHPDFR